jgi:hypothetical protein
MAIITNYGDLKAELTAYLTHARYAPRYDRATKFFENVVNRRLRVLPMQTVAMLTTLNGQVALPADYILWRAVLYNDDPDQPLDYVHPAHLKQRTTKLFTIEGDTFKTNPVDDTVGIYGFHYFQKIPTIIGGELDTNWLLDRHSDAYLFGVLTELFAFARNVEAATLWKQRRDEVFQEIITAYALSTGADSSTVRETAEYF